MLVVERQGGCDEDAAKVEKIHVAYCLSGMGSSQ